MMPSDRLRGHKVLIVEDDYFLASDLVDHFTAVGASIVGPAGTVAEGLALLESSAVDAAVLDINLRGLRVYPIAKWLLVSGIPFVFASGYGSELEQAGYGDVPRCVKPVDFEVLAKTLIDRMDEYASLAPTTPAGEDHFGEPRTRLAAGKATIGYATLSKTPKTD